MLKFKLERFFSIAKMTNLHLIRRITGDYIKLITHFERTYSIQTFMYVELNYRHIISYEQKIIQQFRLQIRTSRVVVPPRVTENSFTGAA